MDMFIYASLITAICCSSKIQSVCIWDVRFLMFLSDLALWFFIDLGAFKRAFIWTISIAFYWFWVIFHLFGLHSIDYLSTDGDVFWNFLGPWDLVIFMRWRSLFHFWSDFKILLIYLLSKILLRVIPRTWLGGFLSLLWSGMNNVSIFFINYCSHEYD